MTDTDVFIISAVRTAIGSGKETGALHPLQPVELTALVMREAVRRAGADPSRLDDAIWGIVTPVGDQGANLARLGVLKAGFPVHVPAVSLNRMCGSSQQAVHFAAQAILAGDADLILAGGTEMMSHQPLGADYPSAWPDVGHPLIHQGLSAELMAEKWHLTRDELDDYACDSHIKAGRALDAGHFADQIVPASLPTGERFAVDQGVRRPPDRDKMRALKPVFKADGVITAGNSSQVSDAAAALLLASASAVGRYNLDPLARVVARVAIGSDPTLMLDGVIPATQKVLKRAALTLDDMDVIEINEAFASMILPWQRELHPDMSKVNPNGGAIALGHPLGATGAVLMTKLVHELQRIHGRYGLQVMCIGHGMSTATVLERV
ncbi:MAG: thiolase family protein [Anaerolineaceae bacterium]|nr:MAG: thiolase family protein [Anaerolineaceae bacterium]